MKKKNRVLFIGPGRIPSFELGVVRPLKNVKLSFRTSYLSLSGFAMRYFYLKSRVFKTKLSLLWVVRSCDPFTLKLSWIAKLSGVPVVFEFDDRFDKILPSDRTHKNVALVAGYMWMIKYSQRLKVYSFFAEQDIENYTEQKVSIGSQYVTETLPLIEKLEKFNSEVINIGVLTNRSGGMDSISRYNFIIKSVKERFGSKVCVYSFNNTILADKYLKPIGNLSAFYRKVRRLKIHIGLSISENNPAFMYKTPNKFRDAAAFGYVCATTDSPIFDHIPDDLMIKATNDVDLVHQIVRLISNKDSIKKVVEHAHEFCESNYNIESVSNEIQDMVKAESLPRDQPLTFYHRTELKHFRFLTGNISILKETERSTLVKIQVKNTFRHLGRYFEITELNRSHDNKRVPFIGVTTDPIDHILFGQACWAVINIKFEDHKVGSGRLEVVFPTSGLEVVRSSEFTSHQDLAVEMVDQLLYLFYSKHNSTASPNLLYRVKSLLSEALEFIKFNLSNRS